MRTPALALLFTLTLCTAVVQSADAKAAETPASALPPAKYIAHEWGTFTSVQGSDGMLLDWRPLVASDLPKFVYDRTRRGVELQSAAYKVKFSLSARQRMETPVIYFYTDQEAVVDVSVSFPKGLITEWYPRVRDFLPPLQQPGKVPELKNGMLRWGGVRLIPAKNDPELQKKLLVENEPSHYYPARETDAAYVRHCNTAVNNTTSYEYEKFLFYRGVGDFASPLTVSAQSDNALRLQNSGGGELRSLYLIEVKDGKGRFRSLGALPGGGENRAQFSNETPEALATFTDRLGKDVEAALVKEGLYAREAAAMVKTWKDSWFEENGVRVLYILPQKWTDEVLPLALSPKPTELVRVMVGRAEVLTPEMERQAETLVNHLSADEFDVREQAMRDLRRFGRFAEPALQRAQQTANDPETKTRATALLTKMREPAGR